MPRRTRSDEALRETQHSAHAPKMLLQGDTAGPSAPVDIRDTGIDRTILHGLAVKLAYTVPHFTTEWATRQMRLPLTVVEQLIEHLCSDGLVEALGQVGPLNFRYAVSQRGRERAARLFEISGYVGPAPVSLEAYTAMLEWHMAH